MSFIGQFVQRTNRPALFLNTKLSSACQKQMLSCCTRSVKIALRERDSWYSIHFLMLLWLYYYRARCPIQQRWRDTKNKPNFVRASLYKSMQAHKMCHIWNHAARLTLQVVINISSGCLVSKPEFDLIHDILCRSVEVKSPLSLSCSGYASFIRKGLRNNPHGLIKWSNNMKNLDDLYYYYAQ